MSLNFAGTKFSTFFLKNTVGNITNNSLCLPYQMTYKDICNDSSKVTVFTCKVIEIKKKQVHIYIRFPSSSIIFPKYICFYSRKLNKSYVCFYVIKSKRDENNNYCIVEKLLHS